MGRDIAPPGLLHPPTELVVEPRARIHRCSSTGGVTESAAGGGGGGGRRQDVGPPYCRRRSSLPKSAHSADLCDGGAVAYWKWKLGCRSAQKSRLSIYFSGTLGPQKTFGAANAFVNPRPREAANKRDRRHP